MFDHEAGTVDRARRLRKDMSLPEVLLWRILKTRPMGVKFRNQHPIDRFVVDFYCHAAKAIFEIDGISHDMGDQPQFDVERDKILTDMGLQVVRIPATEVLKDVESVADAMVMRCAEQSPPSALRAATSPSGGGIQLDH